MLDSTTLSFKHLYRATLAALVALSAQAPTKAQQEEAPSDPFIGIFEEGKVNLNVRARFSYADIDGTPDPDEAQAYTLRTLLGFTTGQYYGFNAKVELVDVRTIDEDTYNGVVSGDPSESVIADPQTTELNQGFLRYANELGEGVIGRQRYILDNARFIGNVGWRQNEQTYDMVLLRATPLPKLTVQYAFIDGVNRIFADERDWSSDSHVIHASYAAADFAKLTLYDYYLDLRTNGAPGDLNTFGGFITGSVPIDEQFTVNYRAELAYQNVNNVTDAEVLYYHLNGGVIFGRFGLSAGYEVLGSDDGQQQFLTPLATAHKFNGFADAYLNNNGPEGLEDIYVTATANLWKVKLAASYHWFFANEDLAADGDDDASEFDLVASYPITDYLSVLGKAAFYNGGDGAPADRERFTLQVSFDY
ncbi:MAG: alginate export family protein [Opitutales bacterium]